MTTLTVSPWVTLEGPDKEEKMVHMPTLRERLECVLEGFNTSLHIAGYAVMLLQMNPDGAKAVERSRAAFKELAAIVEEMG